MNRRAFLSSALGVSGLALVVVCAPQAPPSPARVSTPQTSGGTLRMAMPSEITTLDGHVLMQQALDSTWYIYDRLTQYDATLQPQPMLAESWELTSDDVKASVLRVRAPKL